MKRRFSALPLVLAVVATVLLTPGCATPGGGRLELHVLSSRSDMVSGGDALLEIKLPAGVSPEDVRVLVNGVPTAQPITAPAPGRLRVLVTGLKTGANTVTVTLRDRHGSATITLVNHPRTGPIFSGERSRPFECRTVQSGLGAPIDDQCSVATRLEWFYYTPERVRKTLADPSGPRPPDLGMATTVDGRTVPFIVRVESGTINRSIYRIAVLDNPRQAGVWDPNGWNQRVSFHFGASTGVQYNQGTNSVNDVAASDAQGIQALERGFMSIASSLNNHRVNVDDVLAAETAMMIREHVTEAYGVPRWVVGTGGSGGAIQQMLITQNYPGILDGIMPDAAYPGAFTTALAVTDCRLLNRYFTANPALGDIRRAFEGHLPGTCTNWDVRFGDAIVATSGAVSPPCGLINTSLVYHPVTNPTGVRCTIYDKHYKTTGIDPATGFARRPLDNVGVQYGLLALRSGAITVKQFLDLNEAVGGFDIDGNPIPQRTVGDPQALLRSYAFGRVGSGAGGLATVPIMHARSYSELEGDIHTVYNDVDKIRAQLVRSNGHADNQVIWLVPDPEMAIQLGLGAERKEALERLQGVLLLRRLDLMTAWLDALWSDPEPLRPSKVVRLRPADAVDSCWDVRDDTRHRGTASFEEDGVCNRLYPKTPSPRMAAGAPVTDDVIKCRLKPVDATDYLPALPTPGERARLAAIFPTGVCDYTQPGIGQVPLTSTWLRY